MVPRWLVAVVVIGLVGSLAAIGIIVGSKSDDEGKPTSGSSTAAPSSFLSPSQVGACISYAWAIFHSPEYAAGFHPELGDSAFFGRADLAYSGENAPYSAFKEVGFAHALLNHDTFSETLTTAIASSEGPEWEEVNTLLTEHCSGWHPQTDEELRQELNDSGRGDMDIFTSPGAACAAYCSQLEAPVPAGCFLSQPWTCRDWASDQERRINELELALSTLRAPDNRYAPLTIEASRFSWQTLTMDLNNCYGAYSSVTYPSACWDASQFMQAALYQYTNFAAGLPGFPAAASSRTSTPSTTSRASGPNPTTSIPTASAGDLFSTETTEPIQLFQTPSGNIRCGMNAGFTECRITEHTFLVDQCDRVFTDDSRIDNQTVGPPVDSQLLSATLDSTGQPDISGCMGNTLQFSDFTTVPYGTTVESNGSTCAVAETGVRCVNPAGHGFNLSRAAFDTF